MSYTSKELLKTFLEENPGYVKYIDKEVFYEKDLFLFSVDEMIKFCTDYMTSISFNMSTLRTIRKALSEFFKWSKEKGYIKKNIFELEECSYTTWFNYAIDSMNIVVYYPEDIDRLISNVKINQELTEVMFRMFYEGIHSVKDLISLRVDQIDLENKIVNNGEYQFKISDKLVDALKRYEEVDTIHFIKDRHNPIKKVNRSMGLLIKTTKVYEESELRKYQIYITNRLYKYVFSICEAHNGIDVINPMDIIASGFINFVKEDCDRIGKSNEYLINIFKNNPNSFFYNKILNYANEFGLDMKSTSAGYLRIKYYPYIYHSKYFHGNLS